MTLEQLLNRFDGTDRSIVVVNRTEPDPVLNMLVDTFGEDTVDVIDGRVERLDGGAERLDGGAERVGGGAGPREFTSGWSVADGNGTGTLDIDPDALRRNDAVSFDGSGSDPIENVALLVEEGEVVAGSTLAELGEAVLFVNSDLYTTGSRGLSDIDLPAVITGLEDAQFTLRGYPESNRQKLLLITISRFIEHVAWSAGEGTLRSSFQRLSRLDDEAGTRAVYERVAEAGVDAHLYGVPDDLPRDLDAVVHGGDAPDFTDSWFVVFRPPDGPKALGDGSLTDVERGVRGGVALLAIEREPRVWEGIWSFDPGRLSELNRYVERNL